MKALLQLFESNAKAERAVAALAAAGFDLSHLQLIRGEVADAPGDRGDLAPRHSPAVVEQLVRDIESEDKGGNSQAINTWQGGTLGGLGGTIAGLAVMVLSGTGPALAIGAAATVLGGAATGGGIGALLGAWSDRGIPEDEARDYQAALERGALLLVLSVPEDDFLRARGVLDSVDARSLIEHRHRWQNDPNYRYHLDRGWLDLTDTATG